MTLVIFAGVSGKVSIPTFIVTVAPEGLLVLMRAVFKTALTVACTPRIVSEVVLLPETESDPGITETTPELVVSVTAIGSVAAYPMMGLLNPRVAVTPDSAITAGVINVSVVSAKYFSGANSTT